MALQYLFISSLFLSLSSCLPSDFLYPFSMRLPLVFSYPLLTTLLVYFVIFFLPLSWSILLSSSYLSLLIHFFYLLLTSLLVYFVIFCFFCSILLSSAFLSWSILLSSAYLSPGLFCYLLLTSLLVYFVFFCIPLSWCIAPVV